MYCVSITQTLVSPNPSKYEEEVIDILNTLFPHHQNFPTLLEKATILLRK